MADLSFPFPTIASLAAECGEEWSQFQLTAVATQKAEGILKKVLIDEAGSDRILDADSSLVLCGSFARYEMVSDSDCDWTLLINGVVSNHHAKTARMIGRAIRMAEDEKKGIKCPGSSGTFGNMSFSHDLVHRIGGGADSNENLTRRILMLLESRPLSFSHADNSKDVWNSVVRSILERYFEEDAHFSAESDRKVPRFLLNDLTRYWRTIGVDYAAKYLDQDGKKWAIRNAKLRLSRKLLFAAGLAFCFRCKLKPPEGRGHHQYDLFGGSPIQPGNTTDPFISIALSFAETPPLEYLATFIQTFVAESEKRKVVSRKVFGAYNEWLVLLGDVKARKDLEELSHAKAGSNPTFQRVREIGTKFASGLKLLFFNREKDDDDIANLSLEYVGF